MESSELVAKRKITQIKPKDKYENLKNDFFLQKVFNNLEFKKTLNIIKYNNIKKRINININIYKKYSEKYSSIEIEINPEKNKFGNFINTKEEEQIYYHIYFNNNEEIKRNHINKDEEVNTIKIIIDYKVKSFEKLFKGCKRIESINFKKFYRNNINDMSGMFNGCSSLKEINLEHFDTHKVSDMGGMFYKCSSLRNLNIENFITKNKSY